MRIIASITEAPAVREVLAHLSEVTSPPRIAPARGPPLWEIADDACMDWIFGTAKVNLFALPAAVLGVIPIEPGLFRLVSNGPEPLDLLPGDSSIHEEVWRSAFRISYRQVESYQVPRSGSAARQFAAIGSATRILLL